MGRVLRPTPKHEMSALVARGISGRLGSSLTASGLARPQTGAARRRGAITAHGAVACRTLRCHRVTAVLLCLQATSRTRNFTAKAPEILRRIFRGIRESYPFALDPANMHLSPSETPSEARVLIRMFGGNASVDLKAARLKSSPPWPRRLGRPLSATTGRLQPAGVLPIVDHGAPRRGARIRHPRARNWRSHHWIRHPPASLDQRPIQ